METMRYQCVLSSKKACAGERAKSRTKGDTPDTNTYFILVSFFFSFKFFPLVVLSSVSFLLASAVEHADARGQEPSLLACLRAFVPLFTTLAFIVSFSFPLGGLRIGRYIESPRWEVFAPSTYIGIPMIYLDLFTFAILEMV